LTRPDGDAVDVNNEHVSQKTRKSFFMHSSSTLHLACSVTSIAFKTTAMSRPLNHATEIRLLALSCACMNQIASLFIPSGNLLKKQPAGIYFRQSSVGLGLAVFGSPSPRVGLNMVRAGQQEHSFERALQHCTETL
jgi:hypothetical protein